MRAAAEHRDTEAVGAGEGGAGSHGQETGGEGSDVLSQDHLWPREPLEEAVVDHGLSARAQLLRGLEDDHQRSRPRQRVSARTWHAPTRQVT